MLVNEYIDSVKGALQRLEDYGLHCGCNIRPGFDTH